MKPDERFCPITKMTCKGIECAWWNRGECCVLTLAEQAEEMKSEYYWTRRTLEENL